MSNYNRLVIEIEELHEVIDDILMQINSLPISSREFLGEEIWKKLKKLQIVEEDNDS